MSIESLYQDLLGRGVDQSGAATYAGWSDDQIRNAIMGSQEFANRQSSSQPAPSYSGGGGGGGTDINSIYQNYLGRGVDASGAATYAGWSPEQIISAITSSPEYAQRQGSGGGAGQSAPSGGNPQDLASQVFNAYKTNQNYDETLNALNATPQNADYYRARLGLLGNMMGWQTGQNTGDRNTVYQQELASYLPGARAAGLSDAEINALINKSSAAANQENQQRIAQEAAQGQGWVNQNIPGGWTTVGALAAAAAAPYALGALGAGAGAGAGGALTTTELLAGAGGAFVPVEGASFALPGLAGFGAGAVGQALPYTEAFDAANLFSNGITNAGQLGDILASTGLDPFLAADMGSLAAQGLSAEQIAQVMGYSYNAAELAGTGIESFLPAASGAASSGASLANLLKGGSTLASLASKALGSGGASSGTASNPYSSLLRNVVPTQTAGTGSTTVNPTSLPGLLRGNTNPFNFGQQAPIMTAQTNKADPFAALKVEQLDPSDQYNPLAMLKQEGIYG